MGGSSAAKWLSGRRSRPLYPEKMRLAALLVVLTALAPGQEVNPERLFQEAVAAQQRGDFSTAVSRYERILELYPQHAVVRGNLGAALVSLGRFAEAIAQYRTALEHEPANTTVRMNFALALYKTGAVPDAANEFRILHEADPANARAATLLGDCYLRLNRTSEAVALLEPLHKANPENPDVALLLGDALIRAGRTREGVELAERAGRLGNNPEAWLLAGTAARQVGDFARARDDFQNAVRLNPRLARAHSLTGIALADLGDDDAALTAFRNALAIEPADFETNLQTGALLYRRRDLASARRHIERALESQPAAPVALYQLALVKAAAGKTAEAVADFERLIRDAPDWLEPYVQLSRLYYKVNRPEDGARARATAERLREEAQKRTGGTAIVP